MYIFEKKDVKIWFNFFKLFVEHVATYVCMHRYIPFRLESKSYKNNFLVSYFQYGAVPSIKVRYHNVWYCTWTDVFLWSIWTAEECGRPTYSLMTIQAARDSVILSKSPLYIEQIWLLASLSPTNTINVFYIYVGTIYPYNC